jgi:Uma2 family endonuclease
VVNPTAVRGKSSGGRSDSDDVEVKTMSIASEKTEVFGEPAWDIAWLYPAQGQLSEGDYFVLANRTNRLVEFTDGHIEVLSMPTMSHQCILLFLYEALKAFAGPCRLGTTLIAGIKVRLRTGKYREPDILFMLAEHANRMGEQFWQGADLVMEVVSEDRQHDMEVKRVEYAEAGIPEYWIVDPRDSKIMVLVLEGDAYVVHGEFTAGQTATSRLLPGFAVNVADSISAKP